ncbi:MAG: thioesterase [Bryobacterales bacterium]|jgi:acyl-ACP thioesterase|nr:thioesterase [Bryobacterales bacterium]
MSGLFQSSFVVGSFDADALGEMRPNALVRRLQEAADGHARQHQLAVDQLLATGRTWVLREFHFRVHRVPRFQEVCRVTTWASARSAGLRAVRDFVMESHSGETLAVATSLWLMLDTTRWKLIRLPQEVFAMVNPDPEPVVEPLELGEVQEDTRGPLEVEVHWLDVDFNGHVNNARYLDWMLAAIPDSQWSQQRMIAMGIDFQAEARPGDHLWVRGQPDPNQPHAYHTRIDHASGKALVRGSSWWEARA